MLMMKNKENLKDVKTDIPKKISKIPIYKEVEKEAIVLICSLNTLIKIIFNEF